jgi:hypothetical protein
MGDFLIHEITGIYTVKKLQKQERLLPKKILQLMNIAPDISYIHTQTHVEIYTSIT